MLIRGFLLLCLAGSAFAGSKNEGPPVPMAVESGVSRVADEAAEKAMQKDLVGKFSAANVAWEELLADLTKAHGKRRDKWPGEAKQKFLDARVASSRAVFEWQYLPTPQKELDDSTADLRNRLAKAKLAPLAEGPEAAIFTIAPVGRYRYDSGNAFWCTVLDITPGKAAERGAALATLVKYHADHDALEIPETLEGPLAPSFAGSFDPPTEQGGRLRVSTCGVGMRWKAAAGAMEDLAKDLAQQYNAQRAAAK